MGEMDLKKAEYYTNRELLAQFNKSHFGRGKRCLTSAI